MISSKIQEKGIALPYGTFKSKSVSWLLSKMCLLLAGASEDSWWDSMALGTVASLVSSWTSVEVDKLPSELEMLLVEELLLVICLSIVILLISVEDPKDHLILSNPTSHHGKCNIFECSLSKFW